MKQSVSDEIKSTIDLITCKCRKDAGIFNNQPDKPVIIEIINDFQKLLFPGYFGKKSTHSMQYSLGFILESIVYNLSAQISLALSFDEQYQASSDDELREVSDDKILCFLRTIPVIKEYLYTDVQAAFDGDPAAYSKSEIIISYPGLFAIMVSRIAHELYLLSIPLIPRIMTEYAHSITGIDIHPGATIGKYFFMDHGTGIVIGETTIIGKHVKIYQGVTLGALSTRGGQRLKGAKRHPTIKDNVTIYSGASILGGDTVIGSDVVIGSNAFIVSSVSDGTKVSIRNPELQLKNGQSTQEALSQDEFWYYII